MGKGVEKGRCTVGECPNQRRRRNSAWCDAHWQRYRRTGDVQADKPVKAWTAARRAAIVELDDAALPAGDRQRWLCKPCHRFVDSLIHVPANQAGAR